MEAAPTTTFAYPAFPAYYVADDQRIFVIPTQVAFDRQIHEDMLDTGKGISEALGSYQFFGSYEDAEAAGGVAG